MAIPVGGGSAPVKLPAPPKAAPPPPRAGAEGGARSPTPVKLSAPPRSTPPGDQPGPKGDYGTSAASAFKQTPAYKTAVLSVFHAQPKAQQAAIVKGALTSPTAEGKMVLDQLRGGRVPNIPVGSFARLYGSPYTTHFQTLNNVLSRQGYLNFANALTTRYPQLRSLTALPARVLAADAPSAADKQAVDATINETLRRQKGFQPRGVVYRPLPASAVEPGLGSTIEGAISSVVGHDIAPAVNAAATDIGKTVGFLAKPAIHDAWNLTGGTVEGLYGLTDALTHARFGAALHMGLDPFVHMFHDPVGSIANAPLTSLLMARGVEALGGRTAGFAMRSGAFGDLAKRAGSTVRDPLHLGTVAGEPSPILDLRNYSSDPLVKSIQVARERVIRAKGLNPNVSRPGKSGTPGWLSQALAVSTEARLRRITDEMTAMRQTAGRQARQNVLTEMRKAAPSKAARNAVGHVLQGVIRTPQTAVEDVTKEINRLKAAQTGKRTVQEIWNRKQVRDLSTALKTPGALDEAFTAAAKLRPVIHNQDAYLVSKGLLDAGQAGRRATLPYAMAHMGAAHDPIADAFKKADGTPLSTQEIYDHLKANGTPDPAYIGHFPGKASPARFYSTYRLARGTLGNKGFTGAAFKNGAYDHSWQGLAGQLASRAEAVTKATLHDKVVNRLGIVPSPALLERLGIRSDNGLLTPDEARVIARAAKVDDNGNPIPGALDLTPITAHPANPLAEIRDLQNPSELSNISGIELKALAHAVDDAANRNDRTRNVVLAPTVAVDRFGEQFRKADKTLSKLGKATQQFRRTVLPYSTHWMTQIGAEAGLRSLLAGVLDPRYLADGRRLAKQLETTEQGRDVLRETVNSTFYGSANGQGLLPGVRAGLLGRAGRGALDVHNPNPGVLASAAKAFPPTRLLIATHNRYADTINAAMYSLEHNARLMGLGQLAHNEVQSFGFSWSNAVRLQGKSLADLAERLKTDPALVAKFGRAIDDTFGKYNKFTPQVRAAIQSYAPFLPWYLNAAKYVLWHLPARHPVSSALLASLRQTIAQDVQDGKQAPLNSYAYQELARISPFGIFTPPATNPSTGGLLAGQHFISAFLPQIEGSLYNLAGVNSFGAGPLKGPGGGIKPLSGPAGAAALENVLESFLPGVRYARVVQEGGKPAYGTSTLVDPQAKAEPGTSVVNRIFNPFYSFERAGQSGPAYGPSTASSTGGWGGSSGFSSPAWGAPPSAASGGWG